MSSATAKSHKKPAQPAKPKNPLAVAEVEFAAQINALQEKRAAVRELAQSLPVVRRVLARWPDLVALVEAEVSHCRLNPPPDGAAKKAAHELVRALIVERLRTAEEQGVLKVLYECRAEPEESVEVTDGELARLLIVMLSEDFAWGRPAPARPTQEPPGSDGKVRAMAERYAKGEALYADGDADLEGAVIVERANGSGKKVVGRAADLAGDQDDDGE